MLAEVCTHPSTAEVISETVVGLAGMALVAFILYGFYKMIVG